MSIVVNFSKIDRNKKEIRKDFIKYKNEKNFLLQNVVRADIFNRFFGSF